MDDFVVFHHDKLLLGEIKVRVVDYLSGLKLKLHENKCRVYRVQDGVPFLGMIVFPQKRRLLRKSVVKFKRRMKKFQELYESDDIEFLKINQSVQAWIGHAAHADTMQLRKQLFEDIIFRRKTEDCPSTPCGAKSFKPESQIVKSGSVFDGVPISHPGLVMLSQTKERTTPSLTRNLPIPKRLRSDEREGWGKITMLYVLVF